MKMKKEILKVVLWTFALGIFMGPFRGFMETFNFSESFGLYYNDSYFVLMTWNFRLITIACSVSLYLLLYYLYPKKKIFLIAVLFFIASVILIFYRYAFEEILLFNYFGRHNYNEFVKLQYYIADNTYYIVLYAFVGLVIYFFQRSVYNETLKNEYQLQKNKSELNFLKSQINPHFLFNSLNNVYSLVYNKSENALDAIAKLSSMLRYSLYENEEYIPVSKELEYINGFIGLEAYRHAFEISLDMNIDERLSDIQIAPFIFIPFIENAFKHGDLSDEKNPLRIRLYRDGKDLNFTVKNLFGKREKDEVGGIGIANVKKRMDYIYGDQYELNIDISENIHSVHLKIKEIC